MNKEEFVKFVKVHIVDYNHDSLHKNLEAELSPKASNADYIKMIELYQKMNIAEKEVVINFLKIVIDNTASSFLSVMDGISDVGQKGDFELFYVEDGKSAQLNEDKGNYLIDYYWDTD